MSKSSVRRIPIPANLLGAVLAEINDPTELKLLLRTAALLADQPAIRGTPPSLTLEELLDDPVLQRSGADDADLRRALGANLGRGTLAAVETDFQVRIFLHDNACLRFLEQKTLTPLSPDAVAGPLPAESRSDVQPALLSDSRAPSIYKLHEQHIGTFNHSVREQLQAAEEDYPAAWIEDAFTMAAQNNARSWQYVVAILRRWLQEGRPTEPVASHNGPRDQHHEHGKPGRNTAQDDRTGYVEDIRRLYGGRLPWEGDPDEAESTDS
jgi:DnaD/phage-associated family protein